MKTKPHAGNRKHLTLDSQQRLAAYTTAAGLGALFAGQCVQGEVVQSAALAPYPAILPSSTSSNTVEFPFDVDGDGTDDLRIFIFGQQLVPAHSQVADMRGYTNSLGTTNLLLNPTSTSYLMAWLGGSTINASGIPPTYRPRLAISYAYGQLLNNKFPEAGPVGFSFVSGADGQIHFGYMDVRAYTTTNNAGEYIITSVEVKDIYYETMPNTGITVPEQVIVTSITVGTTNQVTIEFTSNDTSPASAFTLETSAALGQSADWHADTGATILLVVAANPRGGKPVSKYQAITTGSGDVSQFFRITR